MDQNTKAKLIKLLNLTTSDNEHEQLSALKAANKLLKKDKIMWDSLFKTEEPFYAKYESYHNYDPGRREPRFPFGKHKGEEVSWVFENDYDYFMWVLRQPWLKPDFRKLMESFI